MIKNQEKKFGMRTVAFFLAGLGCVTIATMSWTIVGASPRQSASSANTGEIAGKIYFQGTKPKLLPINMGKDPVCVSEHSGTVYAQDGEVNGDGTLPNAFVYVKSSSVKLAETAPRNSVDLTQKGCMYEPHVLGIMVSQPLQVLTLDPTTHNIHVVPSVNREWNVTQQPGSPSVIRKFTKPEIMIPVHCNEHPWMKAYIGVVDNPFFAVTGSQGRFILKNVPAGEYTLAVWTATFGTQEKRVIVQAGETVNADFTFENR
ncbi:MAG TPA: carboxypeptidase regulatory-like domain-containing protein [Candidatus Acidoferrales bacterium]|nr:carboxypeptidase regulatory-like domain-containing protein [Candidatus Acidoferrales bacterium]